MSSASARVSRCHGGGAWEGVSPCPSDGQKLTKKSITNSLINLF